jgi:hypothetical protein
VPRLSRFTRVRLQVPGEVHREKPFLHGSGARSIMLAHLGTPLQPPSLGNSPFVFPPSTAASRRAGRTTIIFCDNMASVSRINRLLSTQQARWRSKWDAMWAHLLTANHWDFLDVQKVKAHQSLHPDTPAETAALIIGNMIADHVANKVVDNYLPRGLPPPAEVRATSTEGMRLHVRRLLDVREALPPVPRPARFATFAKHRSTPAPDFPHKLAWGRTGARCSECYKLVRTKKGWSSECTGAPAAVTSAFSNAKGKRQTLATFAMAGRSAGLLVACLR